MQIEKEPQFSVSIDENPDPGKPQNKKSPPRRIAVGKPFEAKVTLDEDHVDAKTRFWIVSAVFIIAAIFLLGAAVYGLIKGEFSALQSVWSVVGPIYGGIAGYFFSHQTKKKWHSP